MGNEVERIARRMVRRALVGQGARYWYQRARAAILARYGIGGPLWADLFAATSPRSSVQGNVTLADRAYNLLAQGRPVEEGAPYGIGRWTLRNVTRAAAGLPLSGPKVRAFARALRGDLRAVTVDVWMLRAAFGTAVAATVERIRNVTRGVEAAARRLGWEPAEVQAAAWAAERGDSGDLAGILGVTLTT